jgi:hypothetical protein
VQALILDRACHRDSSPMGCPQVTKVILERKLKQDNVEGARTTDCFRDGGQGRSPRR